MWPLALLLACGSAGMASAAQRCVWLGDVDTDRTLGALRDFDETTRHPRLWSLERQPSPLGIPPIRVAQQRMESGDLEWVLERYPAGQLAMVQLQGVRDMNASGDDSTCPLEQRASLQFERIRFTAAACPEAQASATFLTQLLASEQLGLNERLQGARPAAPGPLEHITLDGSNYVLRHHRNSEPVDRRFHSQARDLAEAADAVIDAVRSCSHDGTAEIVSVTL